MNVDALSGLYFIDTNVFVYSFDDTAPVKQRTALQVVSHALRTQRGVISTQVVQEFMSVALRKFARPLTVSESREYLKVVMATLCRQTPSIRFCDQALLLREEISTSFYDSMIIQAAINLGCSTILSEDMQAGRYIHDLRIVNPFAL
jgi:predicted nucleic acid-binding protein